MIVAVILAGGEAKRAKGPKSVWPIMGVPSVRIVANVALSCHHIDKVLVVTGGWREEVEHALAGLEVTLIHNEEFAQGQSTSIKCALNALPLSCQGAIFLMADQPFIGYNFFNKMMDFIKSQSSSIVAPYYLGERKNPVYFDLNKWRFELENQEGDQGGRNILLNNEEEITPFHWRKNTNFFKDFDTLKDYKLLKNKFEQKPLIVIKGAGDLASGTALRLHNAGYHILMTEIEKPTTVRRMVAFSQAVYDGYKEVNGVLARLSNENNWKEAIAFGEIPVLTNVSENFIENIKPAAVIDAIIAKKNLGTYRNDSYRTIALGPGFKAGEDVDAVIETNRGHYLGRLILDGQAMPNTGIPGEIGGATTERLLKAPCDGEIIFKNVIGERVKKGDFLGAVGVSPIIASISGILRGAIANGLMVQKDLKIGDIDPRAELGHAFSVSDKALSIAGGVLEALLYFNIYPEKVLD